MQNITQSLMKDYLRAEEVHFHERRFVWPEYGHIIVGDTTNKNKIPLIPLFQIVGIPLKRLEEVYEYNENNKPTGRFVERGKQALANILGKTINFWYWPSFDLIVPRRPEVYSPE